MMKGKVVLVRFPFDDLSASKVRPAWLSRTFGEKGVFVDSVPASIPMKVLLYKDCIINK
jgi:hypothetical protein